MQKFLFKKKKGHHKHTQTIYEVPRECGRGGCNLSTIVAQSPSVSRTTWVCGGRGVSNEKEQDRGQRQEYWPLANWGFLRGQGGTMTHPVDTTKVEMDVEKSTATGLLPELSTVTGEADSGNTNVEIQLLSVEAEVATEDGSEFIERLKMSGQHISTLDSELAVQSLVQKKISKALIEQLNMNHEIMKAMKAEKLRLARDLENYMGALAMHDEVVAAICAEIKEFEKDVERKRHDPSQVAIKKAELKSVD